MRHSAKILTQANKNWRTTQVESSNFKNNLG